MIIATTCEMDWNKWTIYVAKNSLDINADAECKQVENVFMQPRELTGGSAFVFFTFFMHCRRN